MKTKTIEYIWSGYRSGQQRPCHRILTRSKRTLAKYEAINAVGFTDGTRMYLNVRDPERGEKEIHGYDSLFDEIFAEGLTGFVHVEQLRRDTISATPSQPL